MMLKERPESVYEVKTASRRVERQLDKVDHEIYPKVAEAIESLADNPRPFGVKKLAGRVHRIRVGPYRIIYSIYDREKVVVIDIVLCPAEQLSPCLQLPLLLIPLWQPQHTIFADRDPHHFHDARRAGR